MREMYVILSTIGWVWLGVFAVGLTVALLVQRARRQRIAPGRGAPVAVTTRNDEQKQS